jgi:spermidine synthase
LVRIRSSLSDKSLDLTRRRILAHLAAFAGFSTWAPAIALAQTTEEVYESPYNYIIIKREGGVVSFRRMENGATVSAIDLASPARQVIAYTRYLFAPILVKPAPREVLNIGFGAGAINRLFTTTFPSAKLVTVEIDPMVVDLARKFTDFHASDSDRIVVADGRRYLRQNTNRWDWIIIDAFVRNSQIPPHLTTVEFFKLVQSRLVDDGVMAMNILNGSRLYASLVATIQAVFPKTLFLVAPGRDNVVALAGNAATMDLAAAVKVAKPADLHGMDGFGVSLSDIQQNAHILDAAATAVVLTDEFSPTEYLSTEGGRGR